METIGTPRLYSFIGDAPVITCSNRDIRQGPCCPVATFPELVLKIAELHYRNRGFFFLFRGQTREYRFEDVTTIKASIFRPSCADGEPPDAIEITERFCRLETAARLTAENFPARDRETNRWIKRHRTVRWALIQHYDICATPLLDVTSSLRVAASFASSRDNREGYVYVFGVPNVSGAVTASAEAGVQVLRLSGICPPTGCRPHFQEGYLLGEYPELDSFDQKANYDHQEVDFCRRLVAKFSFRPDVFWTPYFPCIEREAIYPNYRDDLVEWAAEMKRRLR